MKKNKLKSYCENVLSARHNMEKARQELSNLEENPIICKRNNITLASVCCEPDSVGIKIHTEYMNEEESKFFLNWLSDIVL
jgi:hypothetical protein